MKVWMMVSNSKKILFEREYCSKKVMAERFFGDLMMQAERPWEEIKLLISRRIEYGKKTKKGGRKQGQRGASAA